MKTILSLSSILFISVFFTSCVKNVAVSVPPSSKTVAGTWYVSNAASNDGYGWYNINAKLPGIFDLYSNGDAAYSDNLGNMQGYWNSNVTSGEYYDKYGNYNAGLHSDLSIDVSANDGSYIQLYFDNVEFSGNNQFIATYFDGKTVERYTFSRY